MYVYYKISKIEYVIKTRFFLGPYVQFTNLEQLSEKIKDSIGGDIKDFKLRKDFIYKILSRSKCIIVCAKDLEK